MNELLVHDKWSRLDKAEAAEAGVETFMDAAVQLGAEFLACGGPVTRLEGQLALAGEARGYQTTVHATPSAITIYCYLKSSHKTFGRGQRIESFGVDLSRLRWADKWLSRLAARDSRPDQILGKLRNTALRSPAPSLIVHLGCVFGIGVGAALLGGATTIRVLECGLFTVACRMIISTANSIWSLNAIFSDFLACLIAFIGALGVSHALNIPPQMLSLGTLVYVVPGLLLTTAISEIVDQNYLSGTIRLLKALCTFLAMALAYYMATDLGKSWISGIQSAAEIADSPTLFQRLLGAAIIIICSSEEFRAPRKALPGILVCGLTGMICFSLTYSEGNLVKPHFFASFVIGLLSYRLSRITQQPSQIYSVPSVLILAPGMLAFSSFGYGTSDNLSLPSIVRATLISLSIVFGLAAGRMRLRPRANPLP